MNRDFECAISGSRYVVIIAGGDWHAEGREMCVYVVSKKTRSEYKLPHNQHQRHNKKSEVRTERQN